MRVVKIKIMKQYNDWEEIDKDTNGLVTSLTYMVLFVNDQVYNYTVSLMEAMRNSEHYRHNAKRTANAIEKEIDAYNTNIFRIAKANKEAFAEITQSMEEDVRPHIDRYYYTISQILLDHGVSGSSNRIASLSSTINMLAQMSRITISDFGDRMRKIVPLAYNPLSYLALDKVEYLSDRLSSEVTGKDVRINLNEQPGIVKAFTAISNALLRPEVFEKAFDRAG